VLPFYSTPVNGLFQPNIFIPHTHSLIGIAMTVMYIALALFLFLLTGGFVYLCQTLKED
jgi:hypothetical protein